MEFKKKFKSQLVDFGKNPMKLDVVSAELNRGNRRSVFGALHQASWSDLFDFDSVPSDNVARARLDEANAILSQLVTQRLAEPARAVTSLLDGLSGYGLDPGTEKFWEEYFAVSDAADAAKIQKFLTTLSARHAALGLIDENSLKVAMRHAQISVASYSNVVHELEDRDVRVIPSLPSNVVQAIDASGASTILSLIRPDLRGKGENGTFSLRKGKGFCIYDLDATTLNNAAEFYDQFGGKYAAAKQACIQLRTHIVNSGSSVPEAVAGYILSKADAKVAEGVSLSGVVEYLQNIGLTKDDASLIVFGETEAQSAPTSAGRPTSQTYSQPPRARRQPMEKPDQGRPRPLPKPQTENDFWNTLEQAMGERRLVSAREFYDKYIRAINLLDQSDDACDLEHELLSKDRSRLQLVEEMNRAVALHQHKEALLTYDELRKFCVDDEEAAKIAAKARGGAKASSSAATDSSLQNLLLEKPRFPLLSLICVIVLVLVFFAGSCVISYFLGGQQSAIGSLAMAQVLLLALLYFSIAAHCLVPNQEALAEGRWTRWIVRSEGTIAALKIVRGFAIFTLIMATLFMGFALFAVPNELGSSQTVTSFIVPSAAALALSLLVLVFWYGKALIAFRSQLQWNYMIHQLVGVVDSGENVGVFRTLTGSKRIGDKVFEADAQFVFPRVEGRRVRLKKKGLLYPSKGTWILIDDENRIVMSMYGYEVSLAHKASRREIPGSLLR